MKWHTTRTGEEVEGEEISDLCAEEDDDDWASEQQWLQNNKNDK